MAFIFLKGFITLNLVCEISQKKKKANVNIINASYREILAMTGSKITAVPLYYAKIMPLN